MYEGHYYAYCKNNEGLFKSYDDKVSKCKNPLNKNAYLLFYKKES